MKLIKDKLRTERRVYLQRVRKWKRDIVKWRESISVRVHAEVLQMRGTRIADDMRNDRRTSLGLTKPSEWCKRGC